jgi:hypothetical protein
VGWRYQQRGTDALFQHPLIKLKKVNEENRDSDCSVGLAARGFGLIVAPIRGNVEQHMNTMAQHTDYSLVLGVLSAVKGLCVMLMVWYAAKTLWKAQRRAQLERQWRKAKGY